MCGASAGLKFGSGPLVVAAAKIVLVAASAWLTVTPAFSRAINSSHGNFVVLFGKYGATAGCKDSGSQKSVRMPGSRSRNPGEATPTTVAEILPARIGFPTTAGSPPSTLCQKR